MFNWLYAKHTSGCFILRIEDTDEARNTQESLEVLIKGLRWLGLDWDEGPEVGGPYGPYFQSQREALYEEFIERLKQTGRLYEQEGALYFKVSGKPQLIDDLVRGPVERLEEKDFVVVRSNGKPVFHFVNVVDDITMNITHVIRGEDHLSNTSKHLELFKAFGATLPRFAHIPLILKSTGPGKMSKRDEGALIEEYTQRGFLPEALRNYLCLLGWSPGQDREKLPIETLIQLFDLPDINPNNAHFDHKKLAHLNGEYVRELPLDAFVKACKPALEPQGLVCSDAAYLREVLGLAQEKVRAIEEVPHLVRPLLSDDFIINPESRELVFKKGDPKARIQDFLAYLPQIQTFDATHLEAALQSLAQSKNLEPSHFLQPLRLALTGMHMGLSFYRLMALLGQQKVQKRLEKF